MAPGQVPAPRGSGRDQKTPRTHQQTPPKGPRTKGTTEGALPPAAAPHPCHRRGNSQAAALWSAPPSGHTVGWGAVWAGEPVGRVGPEAELITVATGFITYSYDGPQRSLTRRTRGAAPREPGPEDAPHTRAHTRTDTHTVRQVAQETPLLLRDVRPTHPALSGGTGEGTPEQLSQWATRGPKASRLLLDLSPPRGAPRSPRRGASRHLPLGRGLEKQTPAPENALAVRGDGGRRPAL